MSEHRQQPQHLEPIPGEAPLQSTISIDSRPRSARLHGLWAVVLIFGVTLAAYLPAVNGGFIWDDRAHVTRQELTSVRGLARIWSELGATQQYYPVLHSAFWFEHRLWGDATRGYHLVNILLHAFSACLIAVILRRLSIPGARLAAFIFALHPVHVESVAWITEQKNTLSTVFYLSAALVYLHFDQKRKMPIYGFAMALFALALMSKSVTATLPAALLVVFWWRRGRLAWKQDVLPLIPWIVLGAVVGLFTASVEQSIYGAQGEDYSLSALQRCLIAGRVIWFYLGKLFWPTDLIFIYPRWHIDSAELWQFLFPLGVVAALIALWLIRKRSRAPLAGFLFFVGSLFPVLGFFNVYPFIFSFVADHFQYAASLGVIVAVSAGLVQLLAHLPPGVRWAPPVVLVVMLSILTWRQAHIYRDAETLYRRTIDRNPSCWLAQNNLGSTLLASSQPSEAIPYLETALRLWPNFYEAHNNLGLALARTGHLPEAITHYEKALSLNPQHARVHCNLGNALRDVGRFREAIPHYEQAIRLDHDFAEAHYGLGVALAKTGRFQEAISVYEKALELQPDFAEAHNNLGIALGEVGRPVEAIAQCQLALRLKPDSAEAHNSLGTLLRGVGKTEEAIAQYEQAVRIKPLFAAAHYNLALALLGADRNEEAKAHYKEALRLKPDLPEIHGLDPDH